eukprot:2163669-Rhodomonas_salina.1
MPRKAGAVAGKCTRNARHLQSAAVSDPAGVRLVLVVGHEHRLCQQLHAPRTPPSPPCALAPAPPPSTPRTGSAPPGPPPILPRPPPSGRRH